MRIPRRIAELLNEVAPRFYSFLGDDLECAGAAYHSPKPLKVTQVDIGDRWVALCPTCRENLDVYQELKRHTRDRKNEEVPWVVRREFGNRIRKMGEVAQ